MPSLLRSGPLLAILASLGGCSALLPHGEEETGTRWKDFDEAKQAYERVVPFTSTREDLERLGFTPDRQPNVKILNHIEVLDRLIPNNIYERTDLPQGVQACLAAGEGCSAFEYRQKSLHSRRYGNFFADFLNFRRKTETTGWTFDALFVLTGEQVVYKVWSGTPDIQTHEKTTNPLGPLQGVGPSVSTEAVRK